MKHRFASAAITALSLLTLPALAASAQETSAPVKIVAETVRTKADVLSVDAKNRVLTLILPSSDIVELLVDDSVKNLGQVRAGDAVVAEYRQALAVKLNKAAGIRSTVESGGQATAKPGQEPAAVRTKEIDFVADVTDVDTATGVVTILGARGNVVKFRVGDPKLLGEIKKGDQVEGSYVQAVAVAVVPGASAKK